MLHQCTWVSSSLFFLCCSPYCLIRALLFRKTLALMFFSLQEQKHAQQPGTRNTTRCRCLTTRSANPPFVLSSVITKDGRFICSSSLPSPCAVNHMPHGGLRAWSRDTWVKALHHLRGVALVWAETDSIRMRIPSMCSCIWAMGTAFAL